RLRLEIYRIPFQAFLVNALDEAGPLSRWTSIAEIMASRFSQCVGAGLRFAQSRKLAGDLLGEEAAALAAMRSCWSSDAYSLIARFRHWLERCARLTPPKTASWELQHRRDLRHDTGRIGGCA